MSAVVEIEVLVIQARGEAAGEVLLDGVERQIPKNARTTCGSVVTRRERVAALSEQRDALDERQHRREADVEAVEIAVAVFVVAEVLILELDATVAEGSIERLDSPPKGIPAVGVGVTEA